MAGCPRGSETTPTFAATAASPEAELSFRRAQGSFDAGQVRAAERQLQAFRRRFPDDPLAAAAALLLGRIALDREDVAGARALFAQAAGSPDTVLRDRARFYDAVARHRAGDSRGALRRLEPLVGQTTDPDETTLLLRTLAEGHEALGERVEALRYWDRLATGSVPEEEMAALRAGIGGLVESLPPAELDRALDVLPPRGFAWPIAARRAVRRAYEAADLATTRRLVDRVEGTGLPLDDELRSLRSQAERREQVQPRAVGAILPLSGDDRARGQEALRGLMVAAGIPLSGPPGPDTFRLAVRDDRSDPARAAAAVEELVREERVIAIVAGVAPETARAAASRAEALGVPILVLDDDPGVTDTGRRVLRVFPTRGAELEALATHALAGGARRFAVLRPRGPQGDLLAAAVRDLLASHRAELVLDAAYASPEANELARAARGLRGTAVDALLVVHDGQAAVRWPRVLETPAGTQVLVAASRWDTAALSTLAHELPGAIVARVRDGGPGAAGAAAELDAGWSAQWSGSPGLLATFAFDAFRCVRDVVRAGAGSRAAALEALLSTRFQDGATPGRTFTARRELTPVVRLLRADGASLQPLGR